MDLAQYNAFYSAVEAALTKQIDADHGVGTAAALPPGFLQMLVTLLMSLLQGCIPTPTPTQAKAAAAANTGYIEANVMLAIGLREWRLHGKKATASALKVIAASDETPKGLVGQAISLANSQ